MKETESNTIHLKAKIDTSELEQVTQKVEILNDLLEKASSIIAELASKEINLSVSVEG